MRGRCVVEYVNGLIQGQPTGDNVYYNLDNGSWAARLQLRAESCSNTGEIIPCKKGKKKGRCK